MLDLRYYCQSEQLINVNGKQVCRTPLTQLPPELAAMIQDSNIGGIILFAENLESIEQVVTLNYDMQQAARASYSGLDLFISIDQEGGRVARLPREQVTSFSGNMAIGATQAKSGNYFAEQTGRIIGVELAALGFNLNHAPNVDVNVNADNPVINVRSFGEQAEQVAELGSAQLNAMQQQGVIGTLKHFPGHGDTNVDSHTGLPRVDHHLEQIVNVDLLPFQRAIDQGLAKMIMTAHIQYPQLDDSTFNASDGSTMIKPATMSKRILTDLLRTQMGFNGVVITDALDMAGISHFFNPVDAIIETFNAGSDIALMPFRIRKAEDIATLSQVLDQLEQAVADGRLSEQQVYDSVQRIFTLKQQIPSRFNNNTLAANIAYADGVVGTNAHRDIERQLAEQSLVMVKNEQAIPIADNSKVHLLMPDLGKCRALQQAIDATNPQLNISCSDLHQLDFAKAHHQVMQADVVVAASITPNQSAAEMGGVEDLELIFEKREKLSKKEQQQQLIQLLSLAKANNKTTIFVSLRAPYEMTRYHHDSDALVATFSYNVHSVTQSDTDTTVTGPAYVALAKLLTGKITASGQLPVTIDVNDRDLTENNNDSDTSND
ncbi:glycoside hydrolase family 3 protein [Thalassotalea mangrovi]|uniref:beta-N-acetylhexosaminidase n=2 Tax=Thalassotalea mangrovi TaxID=2572245 RepID=A0A4U1BC07_9GAMM|nr:glycoside hydrolase family 3 protein [Thalassotalea mangrovi]